MISTTERTKALRGIHEILNKASPTKQVLDDEINTSIPALELNGDNGGHAIRSRPALRHHVEESLTGSSLHSIGASQDSQWKGEFVSCRRKRLDTLHATLRDDQEPPFSQSSAEKIDGGYSTVRRAQMFSPLIPATFGNKTEYPFVAVKKLLSTEKTEELFRKEVDALERVASANHSHIIKLLGTHQQGKNYFLLFPWADGGDLRSFWRTSKPDTTIDWTPWVSEQLLGLVSALMAIHHPDGQFEDLGNLADQKIYGRHGDLKPENILCFRHDDGDKGSGDTGILKISDFGLSRFHGNDRDVASTLDGVSPTYRPPEFDMMGPITCEYDIWSLGCVFLEFMTWFLLGNDEVETFAKIRASESRLEPKVRWRDDAFFEVSTGGNGKKPKANLKPSVASWIEELRRSCAATGFARDVLDLVKQDMLEIDLFKRATSTIVFRKLSRIQEKSTIDPEYTKPTYSPQKRPPCVGGITNLNNCKLSRRPHTVSVNMVRIPQWDGINYERPNTQANLLPSLPPGAEDLGHSYGSDPPSLCSPDELLYPHPARDTSLQNMRSLQKLEQEHTSQKRHTMPASYKHKLAHLEPMPKDAKRRKLPGLEGPRLPKLPLGGRFSQPSTASTLSELELELDIREPSIQPVPGKGESSEGFACPHYKRDPGKYGAKAWKSCIGPGWSIPRLKEHIYRRHYSKVYRCSRCFADFGTVEEHSSHQRADQRCMNSPDVQRPEMIDEFQKAQMQKKYIGVSDAEKWNIMYRIIFPSDPPEAIPSPRWEIAKVVESNRPRPCNESSSLAAFENYLTHRLGAIDIDMNLLSDIAGCRGLIKAFRQSDSVTNLREVLGMPPLVHDSFSASTTLSSLPTSTVWPMEQSETWEGFTGVPVKPTEEVSFLDDPMLLEAISGVSTEEGAWGDGVFEL